MFIILSKFFSWSYVPLPDLLFSASLNCQNSHALTASVLTCPPPGSASSFPAQQVPDAVSHSRSHLAGHAPMLGWWEGLRIRRPGWGLPLELASSASGAMKSISCPCLLRVTGRITWYLCLWPLPPGSCETELTGHDHLHFKEKHVGFMF